MTPCPSTLVRRRFPRHDPFTIPAPPVPWPTARRPIWSTTLAVAVICILCNAAAAMYQAMPGPWYSSSTQLGTAYDIGSEGGDNVALVYGPRNNGADEFHTNARLIAEAPTMAEALDDIIAAHDLPGDHCEVSQALSRAVAILARIKGAAP